MKSREDVPGSVSIFLIVDRLDKQMRRWRKNSDLVPCFRIVDSLSKTNNLFGFNSVVNIIE